MGTIVKQIASVVSALMVIGLIGATGAAAAPEGDLPPTAVQATNVDRPTRSDPGIRVEDRQEVLGPNWSRSKDVLWTTAGDSFGLNLLTAKESDGYTWTRLATLSVGGIQADQWIGNACLTRDGAAFAVVYAPRTFTNDPTLFTRGAFASLIDTTTGAETYLGRGYSLSHFNPGCGVGDSVVLSQFSDDTVQTRLSLLNASSPAQVHAIDVPTQLTSATVDAAGIVAAAGSELVRVDKSGKIEHIASTTGSAYDIRVDSEGGLAYLQHDGKTASASYLAPTKAGKRAAPALIATGELTDMGLGLDRAGRVHMLGGEPEMERGLPRTWKRSQVGPNSLISSEGRAAVTDAQPVDLANGSSNSTNRSAVEITGKMLESGTALKFTADIVDDTAPETARSSDNAEMATSSMSMASYGSGSSTNPVEAERACAVPRNDPTNQAMQPKPRQVEWAVNYGTRGALTVQRPANWKNLGMPAYTPQGLFPLSPLLGGGKIPDQIMLGILAQESNMWQASRFATPGVTGNPLIGNFYGASAGAPGEWWQVDFSSADCGYGVSQVTDGMRLAGREDGHPTALPYQHQRAIALDYAANVAKGMDMLADKWNETRAAGLSINNGDPRFIENWFFAVWAYNSGFNPDPGTGDAWGVGWFNNPINPVWKASRQSFLDGSPSDASHPQDWPYPEKVMGFAAHSLEIPESDTVNVMGFRTAWWLASDGMNGEGHRAAVKPPIDLFCTQANDCDPAASQQPMYPGEKPGPCLHQNSAGQYDLKCWFHENATWKECDDECGREFTRFSGPDYAAEQPDGTPFLPNCTKSALPSNALVIDNLQNNTPVVRGNCSRQTTTGSFGFNFAPHTAGEYPSKMDLHQLGGGFNGHFYFSHAHDVDAPDYLGGRLNITGTWSLDQNLDSWARVMVHMPDHGAWSQQAAYTVDTGANGTQTRTLLQRNYENRWVSLGVFDFDGVPTVKLTNITNHEALSGVEDIAWDAIAIIPLDQKPTDFVVALGDSFSSGEGASELTGDDYYRSSDNNGYIEQAWGFTANPHRNACHRSTEAWSRKATLPTHPSATIGARADSLAANMDYHLLACSAAEIANLLPFRTAGGSVPTDFNGRTGNTTQYGEVSQMDRGFLDENTTLVTLSVGGNDVKFGPVIFTCITYLSAGNCKDQTLGGDSQPLEAATAARIQNDVKVGVLTVLEEIHAKAPNAKILLMGYPKLFETGSTCVGVGPSDRPWLNQVSDELSAALLAAATNAGPYVVYADPQPTFAGQNLCATNSAIHGMVTTLTRGDLPQGLQVPIPGPNFGMGFSQQSVHPNKAGTGLYAGVMTNALRSPINVSIGATLHEDQPTVYYGTFRYHSTGQAAFKMTTVPQCGGGTRIGLRLSDGTSVVGQQHTESLEWGTANTTKFFKWIAGPAPSYTLPAGSYAFNARLTGDCPVPGAQPWNGVLSW